MTPTLHVAVIRSELDVVWSELSAMELYGLREMLSSGSAWRRSLTVSSSFGVPLDTSIVLWVSHKPKSP